MNRRALRVVGVVLLVGAFAQAHGGMGPAIVPGRSSAGNAGNQTLSERLAGQLDPKLVHVTAVPGGAELRCDLQKLRGRVTADGLTVESLSDTEGRGSFHLRLVGWGRVDPISESDQNGRNRSCVPPEPGRGTVVVDGNRVVVVHSERTAGGPSPAL